MGILTAIIGSIQKATSYTLTPFFSGGPESVDEDSGLMFHVGGTNVLDGTYYWTIETNAGDFATTNGTVSVTGSTGPHLGDFVVTPTADDTTEGSETFTIALRSGSITGPILVTSVAVTINDTSFAPEGSIVFNGSTIGWGTTNATVTTYGAYTYPDETSGSLHTLTGTQYLLSQRFSATATVCVNLWFYPTANNKVIISELGQPATTYNNWHLSILEIDSSNKLKGRVWEMADAPYPTSTGTVNLNAWNHVYFYFNDSTSTFGMSLNNETIVTKDSVTRHLSNSGDTYWGIGLSEGSNMGSSAQYQGKFANLVIDSTLIGSNYTSTKGKYLPPLSLSFPLTGDPYLLVSNTQSDWNLGSTYTIEFWSKETNASTSNIRTVMSQGYAGGQIDLGYAYGNLLFNNTQPSFAEPTPAIWTHVAFVRESGSSNITLYYNGINRTSFSAENALTDGSSDLNIGRRAGVNSQGFRGKLAMIRISNIAKYLANFDPSASYGVEADTKLMLGYNPLTDSTGTHPISVQGAVSTSADFPSIQSLQFSQTSNLGLIVQASSDWNLGTTWTIEFWIKAPTASDASGAAPSSGIWGLLNQGGWSEANCIVVALSAGKLVFLSGSNGNDDVRYTEPTPNVWTHVAIVNNSGTQKVWYNGSEQTKVSGTFGSASYTDSTNPLYIGRLGPVNNAPFNGKMAMVRISNAAKYTGSFTATTTYNVEADTKLFLSKFNPTVDAKAHTITNQGISLSTDFPT